MSLMSTFNLIYITLFPAYFEEYFKISLAKRAIDRKLISFRTYNIRDYALKGKADDYPYGGGGGILIKIEPLLKALSAANKENQGIYIVLLCPQGKVFQQKDAKRLSEKKNLTFVCGHYEGFDQRINNYVNEYLSIGNFITMGGEIPALAITESIMRTIPGLIKKESFEKESFTLSKFDYDSYTRPEIFDEEEIPAVLKSGDHKKIESWRKKNSQNKELLEIKHINHKKKRIPKFNTEIGGILIEKLEEVIVDLGEEKKTGKRKNEIKKGQKKLIAQIKKS